MKESKGLPKAEPRVEDGRRREKIILDERGMIDMPFMILTILLVGIGVIMMFSASYASAYATQNSSTFYFARQGVFALVGIALMLFVSRLNYQMWRRLALPILLGTVVIMLLVPIIGTEEGGAKRWINLFGISFQPSEIAKFAVILSFSVMISAAKDKIKTLKGLVPFIVVLGVMILTLLLQRHLSGMIIITAVAAAMLFMGGAQLRWFGLDFWVWDCWPSSI